MLVLQARRYLTDSDPGLLVRRYLTDSDPGLLVRRYLNDSDSSVLVHQVLSGVLHTVYMVLERWHCSRCMENFHDLSHSQKNSPSDLSDYRPIAITSVVMKCFEKIVKHNLLDLTNGMQDPFQFAYKP